MISINIEATNPFCEEEDNFDSVEVVESDVNADSSARVFVDIFVRAMLGLSFTERTIITAFENYLEEFTVENEETKTKE